MSILIDGVELPVTTDVNIDGDYVDRIVFDGTVVWRKRVTQDLTAKKTSTLSTTKSGSGGSASTYASMFVFKIDFGIAMPVAWKMRLWGYDYGSLREYGEAEFALGTPTGTITAGFPSYSLGSAMPFSENLVLSYKDLITDEWIEFYNGDTGGVVPVSGGTTANTVEETIPLTYDR